MKQLIKILVVFYTLMIFTIWNIGKEVSIKNYINIGENIPEGKAKEMALNENDELFLNPHVSSFDHVLVKEEIYQKSWIPFVYKKSSEKFLKSYLKLNRD